MSFRFDPDGDPTKTTPAEVKLSYEHLQTQISTLGHEMRGRFGKVTGQLGNGQSAFDELRGRLDAQDREIRDIRAELKKNTTTTEGVFGLLVGMNDAFHAIDTGTKPFRWLFAKTFLLLKWLGEQMKWLVPLLSAAVAAYLYLKGKVL